MRCPGIRPPHRSGLRRPQRLRVADDVVHLGLAEHLVDRHAERVARPFEHRRADRLSRAHDRCADRQIEPLARPRKRLHHHLERGREQERVAHAVFRHQRERALGIESAAVADDRLAEIERRAAARPSGRRSTPSRPATRRGRLRADSRRASGRIPAGCRAGTDAASARPSAVRSCRSCRRGSPDRAGAVVGAVEASRAAAIDQRLERRDPRLARAGDADRRAQTPGQRSRIGAKFGSDCGSTNATLASELIEPVLERLGAEQERQRHRDRAELVDRDVRDDRFRPLRQDQRDLVAAARTPSAASAFDSAIRLLLQVPERVRAARARLVFPVQREPGAIVRPSARNTRARC